MYLLDTHTLLWYMSDDSRLSRDARNAINTSVCFYSAATLWEIAIKKGKGRLEMAVSLQEFADACKSLGIGMIPILPRHLDVFTQLPHIHKDPFDRMLAAQTASEGLVLITKDSIIPKYGINTMW